MVEIQVMKLVVEICDAFLRAFFFYLSPSNVLHLVVGEKNFTMHYSNCQRKFTENVESKACKNVSGFTFITFFLLPFYLSNHSLLSYERLTVHPVSPT